MASVTSGVKVLVSLVKCQGCSTNFSDDIKPRNLSCGHVLCTPCTETLLVDEKPCMECGEKQGKGDVLPVNYQLLRFSRYSLKKEIIVTPKDMITFSSDISKSSHNKDLWNCNGHGDPKMLFCRSCNLWVCVTCLVLDHTVLPRGTCRVLQLNEAKDQISCKYEEIAASIQKDIETVKKNFDILLGMHDFCLKHCAKERSHLRLVNMLEPSLFEKSEENNEEVKKVKRKLKQMTDFFQATYSPKEITAYCTDLLQFQKESETAIAPGKESLVTLRLSVEEHFRMEIKKLAKGKVPIYAFLQEHGTQRWTRLCLVQEQLLLYALKEGTPPSDGVIIPYKYMEALMEEDSKTVFLEVEAEGEPVSGRVLMKLGTRNLLRHQMFLMCSGRKGVSFRDTRFFEEENGSLSGRLYEKSDGTRGGALVTGLDEPHESPRLRALKVGTVLGHTSSTKFHIISQPHKTKLVGSLGVVTQGLRVIQEAANLKPVSKCFIKDCGVLIKMKSANKYTE